MQVSHVFRQYGPGVRFVHFLHKTKNRREPGGLRRTRVTDSSVSVQSGSDQLTPRLFCPLVSLIHCLDTFLIP